MALYVVTGPSGVGKGTIIAELRKRLPHIGVTVSATTRQPRAGEVDGREYFFLTKEQFDRRVANGDFIEHAEFSGNRYGTLHSEVERYMGIADEDILLEIELKGARQIKARIPETVRIFIAPPSVDALISRLRGRATDSEEAVEERLQAANEELAAQDEFEHVVVNDDLQHAVDQLTQLIVDTDARVNS